MKEIALVCLTNGNQKHFLQATIESFLQNCNYRPIYWAIFDNGSTDDTWEYLMNLPKNLNGVIWDIKRSDVDLGCGIGVNQANEMVKDYEYVVFLENDWVHLPENISGASKEWLHECVRFLDNNNDVDYIYLRRFKNEIEHRCHGWGYSLKKSIPIEERGNFFTLNGFHYSNNSHIRRNKALYDCGSLPLPEYRDKNGNPNEHKGKPNWGKAELATQKPTNMWCYKWGMFNHEGNKNATFEKSGCGLYGPYGLSTCKYGFITFRKNAGDAFCAVCSKDEGYFNLSDHDARYVRVHSQGDGTTNCDTFREVRESISHPTIEIP